MDLIKEINQSSNPNTILKTFNNINNSKIISLKSKMNDLLSNNDLLKDKLKYDKLPYYLNYILSFLSISYPFINNHADSMIDQLLLIDSYHIHPSILQLYLTNIINNLCINDIAALKSIANIYVEIDGFILAIFSNIFESVDAEYNDVEHIIGFNKLNELDSVTFDNIFNNLINNDDNNNFLKINLFLIKINHNFQIFFDDIDKYDCDIRGKFDNINELYKSHIMISFNELNLYNCFSKMNINLSNVMNALDKYIFYYWIDIISKKNKSYIDNL